MRYPPSAILSRRKHSWFLLCATQTKVELAENRQQKVGDSGVDLWGRERRLSKIRAKVAQFLGSKSALLSDIFRGSLTLKQNFANPRTSGSEKRGLLEKGSFQKSPFSRDSREFRDTRVSREPPDFGKERRVQPFSRDFRDFRDSRDFSSEKTPFVMTPFSGPEHRPNSPGCLFRVRLSDTPEIPEGPSTCEELIFKGN